jgi:hypothetical protein
MLDYFVYTILFFSFLNLVFLLTLSNFVVKLADSIKKLSKDLEDFYYIKDNRSNSPQKEDSGLVDLN